MSHIRLLQHLLPPTSYSPEAPRLRAELHAEGNALDAALAASVRAVMGIDPFRAQEWLPDWERVYGLPDACSHPDTTLQERIMALAIAVQEQAGLSRAWFTRLAMLLGYKVVVHEYPPFCAGSHAGDMLTNGDWQWAWGVAAPAITERRFSAGRSATGEALSTWGDHLL
ncbi:YmfQ family protein, partial [Oleidesulfovibrio sp.]|uniref:YmfQ family protein n=1 Tax=Oleidesulfovibrio sp. TaxID=2909707 RepID=UPI003A865214